MARTPPTNEGKPAVPTIPAAANTAESFRVRVEMSLAMLITMAKAGPTPTAIPATAIHMAMKLLGNITEPKAERIENVAPPMMYVLALTSHKKQIAGAMIKRPAANIVQNSALAHFAQAMFSPI